MRGEPLQELHYGDDGDRFNAWLQAQRKSDGWATVWRDFRGNRMRFVERLRQCWVTRDAMESVPYGQRIKFLGNWATRPQSFCIPKPASA